MRRSVFAGAIVGALFTAGMAVATTDPATDPVDGTELYEAVRRAAAAGDTRASEQLAAIDKYLRDGGLTAEALTLPTDRMSRTTIETVVQLQLEDLGPWRLEIANITEFDNAGALDAYRSARHAALDRLASEDPERLIRVAITPNGPVGIRQLAATLPMGTAGERIIVDVYSAEGWLMASGYSLDGRAVRSEGAQLEDETVNSAAVSIDLFPGTDKSELRANVRVLYATMRAAQAVEVSEDSLIYTVDPLTDIEDAFAGRAAIVEVDSVPDIRAAHADLVLGNPVDGERINPALESES